MGVNRIFIGERASFVNMGVTCRVPHHFFLEKIRNVNIFGFVRLNTTGNFNTFHFFYWYMFAREETLFKRVGIDHAAGRRFLPKLCPITCGIRMFRRLRPQFRILFGWHVSLSGRTPLSQSRRQTSRQSQRRRRRTKWITARPDPTRDTYPWNTPPILPAAI